MTRAIRRFMLGIGAALLIGGWGLTRYADEQQQIYVASDDTKYNQARARAWHEGYQPLLPSKNIYAAGVLGMAVGAGLIGFAVPRRRDRSHEPKY